MTRLDVKPSTIPDAGNGVFTLEPVKKGDAVCYYAGTDYPRELAIIRDDGNPYFCYMDPYATESLDGKTVRVGYRKARDSKGVGQLINDACMFDPSKLKLNQHKLFTYSSFEKLKQIYTLCSSTKANVTFRGKDEWVLYATRDIKEGEELFFSYGTGYWITHFVLECEHPCIKVLCLLDFAKERIIDRVDEDSANFMKFVGIRDGGHIHQVFGVNPMDSATDKLECIVSGLIAMSLHE
jgi:hypothetical protein